MNQSRYCSTFMKSLVLALAICNKAIFVASQNDSSHKPLWTNYRLNEIWVLHGCDDIMAKERPLHNATTWNMLHEAYEDAVGKEKSSIHNDPDNFEYLVEYDIRQTKDKGRGVFAKTFIPKGTLMYDFRRSAQFFSAPSYRQFLMSIRPDLACDVMIWAYLFKFQNNNTDIYEYSIYGEYSMMVDLDEGSFCNDGYDEANAGWDKSRGWESNYNRMPLIYSLRGINPGEEVLCSYSEFSYDSDDIYRVFGL